MVRPNMVDIKQLKALRNRWQNSEIAKDLADEAGLELHAFYDMIDKIPKIDWEIIHKEYLFERMTYSVIAKKYGVSANTVVNNFKRIKYKDKETVAFDKEQMFKEYADGATASQLAIKYGRTAANIRLHIRNG